MTHVTQPMLCLIVTLGAWVIYKVYPCFQGECFLESWQLVQTCSRSLPTGLDSRCYMSSAWSCHGWVMFQSEPDQLKNSPSLRQLSCLRLIDVTQQNDFPVSIYFCLCIYIYMYIYINICIYIYIYILCVCVCLCIYVMIRDRRVHTCNYMLLLFCSCQIHAIRYQLWTLWHQLFLRVGALLHTSVSMLCSEPSLGWPGWLACVK